MAPSSPLQLTALAQSSTVIQLSWRPGFDGHSLITGYKVEVRRESGSFMLRENNVTVLSYRVGNLDPYRTYTFRISARNAIGLGPGATVSNRTLQDGKWSLIVQFVAFGQPKKLAQDKWLLSSFFFHSQNLWLFSTKPKKHLVTPTPHLPFFIRETSLPSLANTRMVAIFLFLSTDIFNECFLVFSSFLEIQPISIK